MRCHFCLAKVHSEIFDQYFDYQSERGGPRTFHGWDVIIVLLEAVLSIAFALKNRGVNRFEDHIVIGAEEHQMRG